MCKHFSIPPPLCLPVPLSVFVVNGGELIIKYVNFYLIAVLQYIKSVSPFAVPSVPGTAVSGSIFPKNKPPGSVR